MLMTSLRSQIEDFKPYDERETSDRELILRCMGTFDDVLTRENTICHFTASCWVVNHERTKALMLFHNIEQIWMWPGGHADGEINLAEVAEREVREETNLSSTRLLDDKFFDLEVFAVPPHVRREKFVSSHIHLNLGYIFEADENEKFQVKPDENSAIRWMTFEDIIAAAKAGKMSDHYQKLIDKTRQTHYNI